MNPTVIYEMGYYIFEQEVIFLYQELKKRKIETSENGSQ